MSHSTTHHPKPIVLVILDGWGESGQEKHNSIRLANTPCFDHLLAHCPHASLEASGEDVGLPAESVYFLRRGNHAYFQTPDRDVVVATFFVRSPPVVRIISDPAFQAWLLSKSTGNKLGARPTCPL